MKKMVQLADYCYGEVAQDIGGRGAGSSRIVIRQRVLVCGSTEEASALPRKRRIGRLAGQRTEADRKRGASVLKMPKP